MHFNYTAVTDDGKSVSGTVKANSQHEAAQAVAARGLIPQSIQAGSPTGGGGGMFSGAGTGASSASGKASFILGSVKARDLILFTKQFLTMLNAGISITRLFEIMALQDLPPLLKRAAQQILEDVRHGVSLSQAFFSHPKCFDKLYCSMIRAGEVSGNLSSVLDRLAYLIEHEHTIKSKIKSALIYPIIIIIALFGAIIFLTTFVMPTFVKMFEGTKVELPAPTQLVIAFSDFLINQWYVPIGFVIVLFVAYFIFMRSPGGPVIRDAVLLRVPLIGVIMQKAAMSRFASIFSMLQASGVSVLESIGIIADTIGNEAISREFNILDSRLREGHGISNTLAGSTYFPPMVVNMIAIGEESGNLDEMLAEVSKHYDFEVSTSVERMSELIGPILVLVLAGVVGFFAVAIMLPIFEMGSAMTA